MLIDTHAHIYHKRFAGDIDDIIARSKDAGVEIIVMPAIDVPSIDQALELANRYDGLYVMTALHPSETKEATEADFQRVVDYCSEEKVVAVGESGLDYYWDRSFDDIQQDFFRCHIRLAIEKDLPLILHNREADDDLVRILEEERAGSKSPDKLRGIFHCFGGSVGFARKALELGFLLGIGGTVTFRNSKVDETLAEVPLEHVVLETDAPFLAPEPYRGKRNEPSYLQYVAKKIADVYGQTDDDVARTTTATATKLFGLG